MENDLSADNRSTLNTGDYFCIDNPHYTSIIIKVINSSDTKANLPTNSLLKPSYRKY